jgi:hypothetical protein
VLRIRDRVLKRNVEARQNAFVRRHFNHSVDCILGIDSAGASVLGWSIAMLWRRSQFPAGWRAKPYMRQAATDGRVQL